MSLTSLVKVSLPQSHQNVSTSGSASVVTAAHGTGTFGRPAMAETDGAEGSVFSMIS